MILYVLIKKSMTVYLKDSEIGEACSMHEIDFKIHTILI